MAKKSAKRMQEHLSSAQNSLELKKIVLVEHHASVSDDFIALKGVHGNCSLFLLSTPVEVDLAEDSDKTLHYIFKYKFGVRLALTRDEDYLVEIEAAYCAGYEFTGKERLSEESLNIFFEKNVAYHLWAYWREHVQSTTQKMNINPITLPMMLPE